MIKSLIWTNVKKNMKKNISKKFPHRFGDLCYNCVYLKWFVEKTYFPNSTISIGRPSLELQFITVSVDWLTALCLQIKLISQLSWSSAPAPTKLWFNFFLFRQFHPFHFLLQLLWTLARTKLPLSGQFAPMLTVNKSQLSNMWWPSPHTEPSWETLVQSDGGGGGEEEDDRLKIPLGPEAID